MAVKPANTYTASQVAALAKLKTTPLNQVNQLQKATSLQNVRDAKSVDRRQANNIKTLNKGYENNRAGYVRAAKNSNLDLAKINPAAYAAEQKKAVKPTAKPPAKTLAKQSYLMPLAKKPTMFAKGGAVKARKYFDNLEDYHANKNAERNEGPLNDSQKTFFADQSAKQLAKQQATVDKIKAGKHWAYKGDEGVRQYVKSKQRNILGMAKGGAVKRMAEGGTATKNVVSAAKPVNKPLRPPLPGTHNTTSAEREAYAAYGKRKSELAAALGKERAAKYMANSPVDLSHVRGAKEGYASMMTPRGMFGNSGIDKKNPKTQAERDYLEHAKTYKDMQNKYRMKKGGEVTKKMASGGLAAGHKSADGIASKGKTKGKMMAKGGIAMKKGKYC